MVIAKNLQNSKKANPVKTGDAKPRVLICTFTKIARLPKVFPVELSGIFRQAVLFSTRSKSEKDS